MELGSATSVFTVSGAMVGRGAGDGVDDRQTGVVGVESVSVSISVSPEDGISLLGGGVVRSKMADFFFFVFLGRVIDRGEGLAAFSMRTARVNEWDSASSLTACRDAFAWFLSWVMSSASLSSSLALRSVMVCSACSRSSCSRC